jgi:MinD superfamily P-loop ATPase
MQEKKFKLAVASGKGGVGKSMFASSLAMLFSLKKKIIALDCDVDAPNLHLWLGQRGNWDKTEKISLSERPLIDFEKCTGCGRCAQICAFGAIKMIRGKPIVNKFFCEGCGACEVVCPSKAIKMELVKNAEIKIKKNIQGFPLISAQLDPGETGSGKIVDQLKQRAEKFKYEMMVLDSPAGTGCPVIAALNGVNFAVLITEPTPSGFADLKRVLNVVDHFKTPYGVIINKWDINPDESKRIQVWFGDKFLGKISYDQRIFQAITQLKPILETNLPVKKEIEKIYNNLLKKKVL